MTVSHRRFGVPIAMVVASLLAGQPVTAKERVEELKPTMPWNVNWAPTYCTLQRTFGTADEPLLFRMNQFGPGYNFEFMLAGKALRRVVSARKITFTFGDFPDAEISDWQAADADKFGTGMYFSHNVRPAVYENKEKRAPGERPHLPYPDEALEAGMENLTIVYAGRSLVLKTGQMHAPIAALRKCTDDLVRQWGLDPMAQASLTRDPKPVDIDALVRKIKAVYPLAPLMMGKQARVNLHAVVDAQGQVTDCSIPESYNDPGFDELACKRIRNTAFEPALDEQGKPVASYWNTTVLYKKD